MIAELPAVDHADMRFAFPSSPSRPRPIGAAVRAALRLCCLIGLSACAHPQPGRAPPCGATGLAAQDGFFVLGIGEEKVGLPASAGALPRSGPHAFAALVVPADVQAASALRPPPPQLAGVAVLPAAASQSRSALVRADVPLSVENVDWNGSSIAIVMHKPPKGVAHPVAAVVVDRSRWRSTRVSLLALSSREFDERHAVLDVARHEALYTLGFRQDAGARFCAGAGCEGDQLLSQAEALQRIARRRECVSSTLPAALRTASPAWRIVTLEPAAAAPDAQPVVSVRVFDQAGPVSGAAIMFTKPPHAGCTATSQADGTARCVLADDHGHAGGHPEFDREPVVATFPGDLRRDPILLPTTRLLPSEAGGPRDFRAR